MRWTALVLGLSILSAGVVAAKDLELRFVDTEGGQATLVVTPAGESLLVDAGWPGNNGRDADRIVKAAKSMGLTKIDYLLVTHYHTDHVGGVAQLAAKFPVGTMIDHGESTETNSRAQELEKTYKDVFAKGVKRLTVKPGDVLPLKGVKVEVVTARGERIPKPLKNGGQKNALCGQEAKKDDDPSENARSIGILMTYGKFRFVDLGDLTWNKELELACPENAVGPVEVYLTTHHGLDASGPKTIVHALKPKVAIMNNGAKKGGSPAAWQVVSTSPGLRDIWQLHYALAGGKENNVDEARIANVEENCEGFGIEVTGRKNGQFQVKNQRNGLAKSYR